MLDKMSLELTTRCNLKCVHCFQSHDPGVNMDSRLAIGLLEAADRIGIGQVILTGGEPTLHPDFVEIYQKARELGFIVNVFTNAVSFPERVWDSFHTAPPHVFSVTLYGLTSEVFSSMTGSHVSFDRPLANCRRMKGLGSDVFLRFHALTLTRQDVGPFVDFAKSIQAAYGINIQVIPRLDGTNDNLRFRLEPDDVRAIEQEFDLDFLPKDESDGRIRECELGRNPYVSANGALQGCPIYVGTAPSVNLSNLDNQLANLAKAGAYVRSQQELNRGVCPAWLHLEGALSVKRYLESHGVEGL